ncbi:MBL fold metallo-hydrolase [Brumimicrobium glaciale]|uniref:MBL fold metallo-hydrolase n=1 Tax=Brumimicrobium glaciale TaxID=200475 RepID=A0A4Q4KND1_9FLAO|nr:MBL fold metallo-hydrolase [Brumimicrobium glaciale]RYM34905.1 MBL fold metallo-hydrolase [Brumimicrobium glaciale]
MKHIYTLLSFALGMLLSFTGLAQSNEIKIKFIGNCGLYMTDGDLNIYSDFPYKSGAYGYMEFDNSELDSIKENSIFIFTHKHADHYSGKNMRKTLRAKGGKKYGPSNIKKLKKFADSNPDFEIQTFKTKHRFSFSQYSYLITWHRKKIFLSGDTESAETIGEIKNMDMAFLPSWIFIDAKEKDIKIDAKRIGLYHLYPNETVSGNIPDNMIILRKQKAIISLPY